MNTVAQEENIKVTSYGGPDRSISLEGFSKENFEKMLGSMKSGAYYVKVEKGKLIAVPTWQELPKPAEDSTMVPFWRRYTGGAQSELFDEYQHSKNNSHSPSITIQSLCGYNYTPENYKFHAEQLESWGFECLRSRRGPDAKFWEVWFLPGLWCAKGAFGDRLKGIKDDKKKLRIALEFLRYKSSFGTLDVSSQRLCMSIGEDDY